MDQRQNNLDRIRAFDAEEGEWRTINGAHVLIKNGRIAAGAGGALNGQKFQGHSIKKMPAGMTGRNHGYLAEKYSREYDMNRSKAIEERDRARNENGGLGGAMYAATGFGPESKEQQYWDRMKEAGRKIDQLEERPFRMKKYLAAHPELRRGGRAAPQTAAPSQNSTPTSSNHRLKRMPAGYTGKKFEEVTPSAKYIKPDEYSGRNGIPGWHESLQKEGLRRLAPGEELDPSKRYALAEPDSNRAPRNNAGLYYSTSDPYEYKTLRGAKIVGRGGHGTTFEAGGKRITPSNYDMSIGRQTIYEEKTGKGMQERAAKYLAAHPELRRGGRAAPQTAAPSQNSTPTSSNHRLKRMPAGYTGKNYKNEVKRLEHNAKVYQRTARKAYEKAEREARPLGEAARIPQSQLPDYKRKLAEKMDKRDNDAIDARLRHERMQERIRAMRQKRPDIFGKAGRASASAPAPAPSSAPAPSAPATPASRKPSLSRKTGFTGRTIASEMKNVQQGMNREDERYKAKLDSIEKKYGAIAAHNLADIRAEEDHYTNTKRNFGYRFDREYDRTSDERLDALRQRYQKYRDKYEKRHDDRLRKLDKKGMKNERNSAHAYQLAKNIHANRNAEGINRLRHLADVQSRASEYLAAHPELRRGGRAAQQTTAPSQNSTPTSSNHRLKRMPAGYTGKNYGQEAKRLDHNARVYERTARLAMEKKEGKMAPAIRQARAEYSAKQDAYERAAERLDNRRRSQKWKSGRGVNGTQKRDMHYNHLQNLNSERRGNQAAAARTRVEALEQELGDYKDKMSTGVSSRYSSASAAKNRLASMRKMAKALKQSHPEMFEKVHALKSKMSGR